MYKISFGFEEFTLTREQFEQWLKLCNRVNKMKKPCIDGAKKKVAFLRKHGFIK